MAGKLIDRDSLIDRAGGRCEYCMAPEQHLSHGLHVDHVIAVQHGGTDAEENLAIACYRCNCHKGPNIASIDPFTGALTALFHPRRQTWQEHFEVAHARISGKTACGRATVALLDLNSEAQVEIRRTLIQLGAFSEI